MFLIYFMYSLTKSAEEEVNISGILKKLDSKDTKDFTFTDVIKFTSNTLILILRNFPEVYFKPYSLSSTKIRHLEGFALIPIELERQNYMLSLKNKNNKLDVQILDNKSSISSNFLFDKKGNLTEASSQYHKITSTSSTVTKISNECSENELVTYNKELFELKK